MLEWLINAVRRMWLEAELSALHNNALLLQCELVDAPKKLDELQAQIDRNGTLKKSYGNGMLVVGLLEPPQIVLGEPPGKLTLNARLKVAVLGNPAVPVEVLGASGVRYDDTAKAFFLDNPVANAVHSQALPREAEPMARQAISQLLNSYFRSKPVYVLREDGSLQEKTARWLLRSIRIEPGRVAAVLSPV